MVRPFRTALAVLLTLAFTSTVGACGGGGGSGGGNAAPAIGAPTGPGTVGGTEPTYTTLINSGDSLDFSVIATDANAAHTLTFTAWVTGGSLTEAQAGFLTFPSQTTGTSPQTLTFAGTAARGGDVEITFLVEDGTGAWDTRRPVTKSARAPGGRDGLIGDLCLHLRARCDDLRSPRGHVESGARPASTLPLCSRLRSCRKRDLSRPGGPAHFLGHGHGDVDRAIPEGPEASLHSRGGGQWGSLLRTRGCLFPTEVARP